MTQYTQRYKYRTIQQTSNKSKYITWGLIISIGVLWLSIVDTPIYQQLIALLSI